MDRFTSSESRWRWEAGSEVRRERGPGSSMALKFSPVDRCRSKRIRSFPTDGNPGRRIHLRAFPPSLSLVVPTVVRSGFLAWKLTHDLNMILPLLVDHHRRDGRWKKHGRTYHRHRYRPESSVLCVMCRRLYA